MSKEIHTLLRKTEWLFTSAIEDLNSVMEIANGVIESQKNKDTYMAYATDRLKACTKYARAAERRIRQGKKRCRACGPWNDPWPLWGAESLSHVISGMPAMLCEILVYSKIEDAISFVQDIYALVVNVQSELKNHLKNLKEKLAEQVA